MTTYYKIGFHEGAVGLGLPRSFLSELSAAGIPFIAKKTDGLQLEAQQEAGILDTVIFRRSIVPAGSQPPPSGNPDLPDYNKSPDEAALEHWNWHRNHFPPELDPAVTWVETINEVADFFVFGPDEEEDARAVPTFGLREVTQRGDGRWQVSNGEWLAQFARETAAIALVEGYKWAAFGWATGQPDLSVWEGERMHDFLRMCANFPNRLAVALHEYSLTTGGLLGDGWLVGRFEHLFAICDAAGIGRPTTLITEFGWGATEVPGVDTAMIHLTEAAELYARYPQVRGAAIWCLNAGWNQINRTVIRYVDPLKQRTLTTTFPDPPAPPDPPDCPGQPRVQYPRIYYVVPPWATDEQETAIYELGRHDKRTVGPSFDDAGVGDLTDKTAVLFGIPHGQEVLYRDWYHTHYPGTAVEFRPFPGDGNGGNPLEEWPVQEWRVTQWFGERPEYYQQFGLPGHDGLDIVAATGDYIYSAGAGDVYMAQNDPDAHNYGIHVRIQHAGGWKTIYAHLQQARVELGDSVESGELVGLADNTGNSSGSHLHLGLKKTGETYTDPNGVAWPYNLFDPWLLLEPLYRAELAENGRSGYLYADYVVLNQAGDFGRLTTNVNLREGAGTSHRILQVCPARMIAWIAGPPVNGYLPVIVPSVDEPPIPPPPGMARLGLHASADPGPLHGGDVEFAEFATLNPGVIKVLSAHSPDAVARLAREHPDAYFLVRLFLQWGGRVIAPTQFVDWTRDDALRTVGQLVSAGISPERITVEMGNEPNLVEEGWTLSWSDGRTFATWLEAVIVRYRELLPTGTKLAYPGLSPGGDIPNVRTDSARFMADSASVLHLLDSLCAHAYWSETFPLAQALAQVDTYLSYNKPIWVSEASRNDRPAVVPPSQYAAEYRQFWMALRERPSVQGVTYFAASASNPYFEPECWIWNGTSKGIAAAIRS